MSFLNPKEESRITEDAVVKQIAAMFPFVGKRHTLALTGVKVGDTADIHDIHGQKTAKMKGRTWSAPVYGDLELRDNKTGAVLDKVKGMKISGVPSLTNRFSYIVNGAETQVSHLWRLKSGVYSLVKDNGILESQFNLAKGRGFAVHFNPETRLYTMKYGTSNIKLGPVLQALGVSTDEMSKNWGSDITEANLRVNAPNELKPARISP